MSVYTYRGSRILLLRSPYGPDLHQNSPMIFFFPLGSAVTPQAAFAICRIAREMGESPRASGVAAFCILRAVELSSGIFHCARRVRALVICSSSMPIDAENLLRTI